MTLNLPRDVLSPVLDRLPGAARRAIEASPTTARTLRDVAALVGSWTGKRPSFQTYRREESTFPGERKLRVVAVHRETDDAVSLVLEKPEGEVFPAGQFLTFILHVGGREVRRSYSLSCSPSERHFRVTVKRVAGGLASTWMTEQVKAGDVLRMRGPSGNFTFDPRAAPKHLLLIGGGSGITPLFGILKTALETNAEAEITLLFANRSASDVIFRRDLDALAAAHPNVRIEHILESEPGANAQRRLTEEDLARALRGHGPGDTHAYVCGPEPMMDLAVAALGALGFPSNLVHTERFLSLRVSESAAMKLPNSRVTLRLAGREAGVSPGQTLLEGALAAKLDLDFSCTMGGCGACKARLCSGEILMDEPNCLTDDERKAGLVLTCISRPITDVTLEPAQ